MNILSGENKLEIILMLLFQIGFGIKFNFVGEISISEILLVAYFFLFYFRDPMREEIEMRKLELCYFSLILVQCLMEFLAGNSLANAMKGIAITFVSLCYFYFLLKVFNRNLSLVIWALLGYFLEEYFMGKYVIGSITKALMGQDAVYMKFVLAHFLIDVGLIIALQLGKKASSQLFVCLGVYLIVCGARSRGMMCVLTGIITWVTSYAINFNFRALIKPIIAIVLLGYGGYCIYVNRVLAGDITVGNNEHIHKIENPYNPAYLLMEGRSETFVGWIAFTDNPIIGWGAWKKDSETGNKYHKLQSTLGGDKIERKDFNEANIGTDVIPCHSVIIAYACYNGIFALILVCMILFSCIKYGIKAIGKKDEHDLLLVYFIVSLCWNMIFSPQSHFRYTLPLSMAFMVACYWQMIGVGGNNEDDEEEYTEEERKLIENQI